MRQLFRISIASSVCASSKSKCVTSRAYFGPSALIHRPFSLQAAAKSAALKVKLARSSPTIFVSTVAGSIRDESIVASATAIFFARA